MNKTTPAKGQLTVSDVTYTLTRQSRTAYGEFMNPATKYEKVYFQVDVFGPEGKRINFGFVDDEGDQGAIERAVLDVIEWYNTPNEVLASMHSARD